MEQIIGRKKEINTLESIAGSPHASFLALYGRRRVGKTLRHTPWLTMITTEGIAKGKYAEMIQSQVTLEDLFVE